MKLFLRAFQVLLVVAMMALLVGPAVSAPQAKAQPQLLQVAVADPAREVRVIVQKTGKFSGAEEAVARLGGAVTQDLSLINAFAARLPAAKALELSRSQAVRWVSLDGVVEQAGKPVADPTLLPANTYLDTLGVRSAWDMGVQGQGVTVAVIDSGISLDTDFGLTTTKRLLFQSSFNPTSTNVNDVFGHGTHVAGIIGGDGADSAGFYSGVAPKVNLISLKVSDETGLAYESDAVAALQWVLNNKSKYNIRIVNLSLNTTTEQSYHVSPLDAACEILWFNGVVVIASAGNLSVGYNTINAAPANDPFIITVGATDEKLTVSPSDDVVAAYSTYGKTTDGFVKPDILAPGTSIYSVLSKSSSWATQYPDRVVAGGEYFRLSGTSMAAPMVAGAAALLLQKEPNLTPDQVKYRLLNAVKQKITVNKVGYPYLNVSSALSTPTTQSANTGLLASGLLTTGTEPVTSSVSWNSVSWNSVSWNSVSWNSVSWNSVSWNSVSWNSTYWGK